MPHEHVHPTQPAARVDRSVAEGAGPQPSEERSLALEAEWLEPDGLGGFASGTVWGTRTRRQHALLQVAADSPAGRTVLVNGLDAWVETPNGAFPLTSQRYHPDVVHPECAHRLESFSSEPWPQWRFALEDGTLVEQEIFAQHGKPLVAIGWRLVRPREAVHLFVRPFLSGRNVQALHRENPDFDFAAERRGRFLCFNPYPNVPGIFLLSNAEYAHDPQWYRNFVYTADAAEAEMPDDIAVEDLASPGVLEWDLSSIEAVLVLASEESAFEGHVRARAAFRALRAVERARRRQLGHGGMRASDAAP